jgi:hypothetical protein
MRKFTLVCLILFSLTMFSGLVKTNTSHAASNEELEARIKELEEVVLGHKRHPEHPLTEINITGGLTGIIQGSGDVPRWSAGDFDWDAEGETFATGSLDLVIEFPVANNHLATVFLEAGAGDGLQAAIETGINNGVADIIIEEIGPELATELELSIDEVRELLEEELEIELLHGTNDDAIGFGESGESDVHVLEAWFEGSYLNELFTVTMGKIDLTNYLEANEVANDETAQFLSSGFVNNLTVDFPDDNGPGLRLTVAPTDMLEINLGVADAGAEWDNIFDDGFGMLELHLMPQFGELQGNYRLYGWLSDKDHENIEDGEKEDYGSGYGISADQQLPGGLTVFGRIGTADDDIYAVETAWSAGAQLSGELWGRADDIIACAYGEAILNDDHPDWQDLKDLNIDTADEQQLEIYYSLAVNDNITISPHAQWIMNPAGIAELDDIWVFGTRAQINFF